METCRVSSENAVWRSLNAFPGPREKTIPAKGSGPSTPVLFALPLPLPSGPKSTFLNGPQGVYLWVWLFRKNIQVQIAGRDGGILPLPELKSPLSRTNTYYAPLWVTAFKLLQIYCFRGTKSQRAVVNSQHDLGYTCWHTHHSFLPWFIHTYQSPPKPYKGVSSFQRSSPFQRSRSMKGPQDQNLLTSPASHCTTDHSFCACSHLVFFLGRPSLIPQS